MNPLGLHDFYNEKAKDGSHTLQKGQSMSFRYRAYIHAQDAKIVEQYKATPTACSSRSKDQGPRPSEPAKARPEDWIPARAALGWNDDQGVPMVTLTHSSCISFHYTHSFDEVQLRELGTQVAVTL